jgi:hypothetical protein
MLTALLVRIRRWNNLDEVEEPPVETGDAILMEDGVSFILIEGGTDRILLEG